MLNNFLVPHPSNPMNVCLFRVKKQKLYFLVTKYLLDCIIYCMTFLIHKIQSGLFYQEEEGEINNFI